MKFEILNAYLDDMYADKKLQGKLQFGFLIITMVCFLGFYFDTSFGFIDTYYIIHDEEMNALAL